MVNITRPGDSWDGEVFECSKCDYRLYKTMTHDLWMKKHKELELPDKLPNREV